MLNIAAIQTRHGKQQSQLHTTRTGTQGNSPQLDVSFKVGTVLVAIDAKSIPVSPGYRAYGYEALKTRWKKFAGDAGHEGYVDKADQQALELSSHPRGTNYDLLAAGYTHVLTILCSPFPEYIDTEDPSYYLHEDLPRIATPQELRELLADTDETQLKSIPFTRRLLEDAPTTTRPEDATGQ